MNNFHEQLEYANSVKRNPFWESFYREFFPNVKSISGTIEDKDMQLKGIDRIITLTNGKTYLVDEKLRQVNYPEDVSYFKPCL